MILIFIKGTDTFAVDDETFKGLLCPTVHQIYSLIPDPETLRARVDSWTDTEAGLFRLFKQYSVQQETLPCTILASYCNDSYVFIFKTHQEVPGFLSNAKAYQED